MVFSGFVFMFQAVHLGELVFHMQTSFDLLTILTPSSILKLSVRLLLVTTVLDDSHTLTLHNQQSMLSNFFTYPQHQEFVSCQGHNAFRAKTSCTLPFILLKTTHSSLKVTKYSCVYKNRVKRRRS